MKALIASCGHIRDMPRRMLLELWARNIQAVAPKFDVLYVDSTSPVPISDILEPFGFTYLGAVDDDTPIDLPKEGGRFCVHFPTADWGHRSNEAGRAVRKCLQTAIHNDYDWVFYWESDALLALNVQDELDKLVRLDLKVAMPWCMEYNYPETQFCFYQVKYLVETNFVNTYAWNHADSGIDELRREREHKDELMILPWRGRHNNTGWVRAENFHEIARPQIDWISHCDDFTLYLMFLQHNGIKL